MQIIQPHLRMGGIGPAVAIYDPLIADPVFGRIRAQHKAMFELRKALTNRRNNRLKFRFRDQCLCSGILQDIMELFTGQPKI